MKSVEFHRILVANRGEIASRIVRAIHGMDKLALVIYADNDRDLPFVSEADEAYSLGSGDLSGTYLDMEAILEIARESRADAIHPGYGFLAENAAFARACENSGFHFIGPSSEAIDLMGNKSRARDIASRLGIPVAEGVSGDLDVLIEKRLGLPYPLLIKPAAGGGGKGMRIIRSAEAFEEEARAASREAQNYFGSGELYVERFLEGTRHVEVQVIADHHGNMAHLFERECSLQRRYQKIIEEAPSGFITEETRKLITSAALELTGEIGYTNAGTVEFLVDQNQHFYFMEMNTRIQVEHPCTEELTGIDLVREQISIAQGLKLSFTQEDLVMKGHVLEARLYAEDPLSAFLPSSGTLKVFDLPADRLLRTDSGYRAGNTVGSWYDPMLAKLIVKGDNRLDARNKLIAALEQTYVDGLSTNRDFLIGLLRSDLFKENRIHTGLLDMNIQDLLASMEKQRAAYAPETLLAAACFISLYDETDDTAGSSSPWQQIGHWRILPGITIKSDQETHFIQYRWLEGKRSMRLRINGRDSKLSLEQKSGRLYMLRIDDRQIHVWGRRDISEILLDVDGHQFKFWRTDIPDRRYIPGDRKLKDQAQGEISAPLNGRVVDIRVKEGERVTKGETLIVIESMKMENLMLSDHEAHVKHIEVSVGQQVRTNQLLLTLASI